MAQKARISVSAEVFGKYNMKEAFVAKVIPKNQEIKNKIKESKNKMKNWRRKKQQR